MTLVGFTVIFNDVVCFTYEHLYTIAGKISNRTTFNECLLLQPKFEAITMLNNHKPSNTCDNPSNTLQRSRISSKAQYIFIFV